MMLNYSYFKLLVEEFNQLVKICFSMLQVISDDLLLFIEKSRSS